MRETLASQVEPTLCEGGRSDPRSPHGLTVLPLQTTSTSGFLGSGMRGLVGVDLFVMGRLSSVLQFAHGWPGFVVGPGAGVAGLVHPERRVAPFAEQPAHGPRGVLVIDGQPLAEFVLVNMADSATPSLKLKEGVVVSGGQSVALLDLGQVPGILPFHTSPVNSRRSSRPFPFIWKVSANMSDAIACAR